MAPPWAGVDPEHVSPAQGPAVVGPAAGTALDLIARAICGVIPTATTGPTSLFAGNARLVPPLLPLPAGNPPSHDTWTVCSARTGPAAFGALLPWLASGPAQLSALPPRHLRQEPLCGSAAAGLQPAALVIACGYDRAQVLWVNWAV